MSDVPASSWTDPEYVATIVGVLAVGAQVFCAELVSSTLTAETVGFGVGHTATDVARVLARRLL